MCKKVIVNGTKIFGIKKTENSELQSMSPALRMWSAGTHEKSQA